MTQDSTISITNLKQQFDDQGFIILRQLLSQETVNGVRDALETYVDQLAQQWVDAGVLDNPHSDASFETRLDMLVRSHPQPVSISLREELHWPSMHGLFFDAQLLDIVEALLGPEVRLYPNYTVRPKLPDHKATEVLWHQDAGYTATGLHGRDTSSTLTAADLRMVNVWSPLVPARVHNGCMQFIPETHKCGVVPHVDRPYYLEIVKEELEPRLKDVINIELDPGDVVLFSNLLFHRGLPNQSQAIRWSCDWRYQDATQSTLRDHHGHLARSKAYPQQVVRDAKHWAELSFT